MSAGKVVGTFEEAVADIGDGASLVVGGFGSMSAARGASW